MRTIDWLLIFILLIGLVAGKFNPNSEHDRRHKNPRRPSPQLFEEKELWDHQTLDWLKFGAHKNVKQNFSNYRYNSESEAIIRDYGGKTSSTGTAFSVSKKGIWLSAKHVVEGCSKIGIQIGTREILSVTKVFSHPNADVAILKTKNVPLALPISKVEKKKNSYNIGFPKGAPGALHTRFLGLMTLRHIKFGRRDQSFRERVHAWAEVSRIPHFSGSIAGLSGGAVLNEDGEIIGIVQAENRRRGRILTANLSTIKQIFVLAKINVPQPPKNPPQTILTKGEYPIKARQLIITKIIAKVLCKVY